MHQSSTLTLWIVAIGTAIIGLIALSIVFAVIYSSIVYGKTPDILANWGGLIIGFFIGTFFNFVRAAVGVDNRSEIEKAQKPQKVGGKNAV